MGVVSTSELRLFHAVPRSPLRGGSDVWESRKIMHLYCNYLAIDVVDFVCGDYSMMDREIYRHRHSVICIEPGLTTVSAQTAALLLVPETFDVCGGCSLLWFKRKLSYKKASTSAANAS